MKKRNATFVDERLVKKFRGNKTLTTTPKHSQDAKRSVGSPEGSAELGLIQQGCGLTQVPSLFGLLTKSAFWAVTTHSNDSLNGYNAKQGSHRAI